MLSGIASWVEDKAAGYLKTGIQAGGTLAGNAVGSVGGLVEKAGQTAASGIQGGIGGVGSYINNYGETIKRSMSADGPVSTPAKKTAVKPSAPGAKPPAAQKALPSSQPAKNARPTASVSQKALPAPSQKSTATSKPNTRSQAANKPNTRPPPSTKPGGPTAPRAQGPVGVSKPASNASKPMSKATTNSTGKVVPSAKSRPRPTAGKAPTTRSTAAPAKGGDILGIGNNIGDINKTRSTQNKSQGGAARKPSAADPLAMGDLENIGKKK